MAPVAAADHRLHGMAGWLRFFSVWITLSVIGGVVLVVQDIRTLLDAGVPARGPDAAAEAVVGLIASAVQVVVAVQWFRTWPHFRRFFLGVTVLASLVAIGFHVSVWLAPDQGRADAFAEQVASDILGTAALCVLLAYMQVSRRYRVTFENRVRRDDPLLAGHVEAPA